MTVSEIELKKQLFEYRKAIRAMMKFYDSSWSLFDLFHEELNILFESVTEGDLSKDIDNSWGIPSEISFEAYRDVTAGVYNWYIESCSNKEFKARKNSIYMTVELFLDYWPLEQNPGDSISAIGVYGYRVKDSFRGTSYFSDLDWKVNDKLIDENCGIDEKGLPQRPMSLSKFPSLLTAMDGKYEGDYATGLYDLSTLTNAEKVKELVIDDIIKLLKAWNYKPI